ncbi:unnamed protein product [Ostreobium quekettii]|uniref:Uncharacterized protein n=1 Tax=Ostreobium quekettii TaxID=121088 RepID=A0A8S1IQM1_9CHLO|nr:unnamed protein product [Ostreobium quekettii]|eukprot:evm.model.scf_74.3 EVM.evm.TU.scf_74.3   scf_74:15780-18479(-)
MADEESGGGGALPRLRKRRRFDCCLGLCWVLNLTTGVSAMLCLVAHGMAVIVGPEFNEGLNAFTEQTLRLYGILFSLIIMLVETEWQFFLDKLRILEGFVWRSLAQLFLAILTLQLVTVPERDTNDGSKEGVGNGSQGGGSQDDFEKSVRLYGQVSGNLMLGCSAVYFLAGLVCCGSIKRARQKRVSEKTRLERDLQALGRREQELKHLLATYSGE